MSALAPLLPKAVSLREGARTESPSERGRFRAALINMAKAVFGTGVLALPWAFARVGATTGCVLTCCIGAWNTYTMALIGRCALAVPAAANYEALVRHTLGPACGFIAAANLVLHQVLVCASYLVFMAECIAPVIGVPRVYVVLLATLAFIRLCWLRDLARLAGTSAVGTCCLCLVMIFLLRDASLTYGTLAPEPAVVPSATACALFFGCVSFTFGGHSVALPACRSMGSTSPRFGAVMATLGFVGVPLSAGFGALAAIGFGQAVPSNVLLASSLERTVAPRLAMSLTILMGLPVKMFPATELVEALVLARRGGSEPRGWARNGVRTALPLVSMAAALLLPDFAFLVAFIGAFCMGLLGSIMPPAMHVALLLTPPPLAAQAEAGPAGRRPRPRLSAATTASVAGHGLLIAFGLLSTSWSTYKVVREHVSP